MPDAAAATFDELRMALECSRSNCQCHQDRHPNRHCPAHDDANPSFTVTKQPSGTVTVNCKTGCSQDAVISSLLGRNLWPIDKEGHDPKLPRRTKLTREWDYVDPLTGEIVAVHGRHDFIDRDPDTGALGKLFRWRLPDGSYGQGLQGKPLSSLPLYNAQLIENEPDETIWICEGEKAADAATDHGLIAVSLPGGAGQKDFGNQLAWLVNREVVLWPDNDEAGFGLMTMIATHLPHAKQLTPPGPSLKGDDAYDYFVREGDGKVEALLEELKDPEPIARHSKGAVEITYPTPLGNVIFTFRQISPQQNSLRSYLEVSHTLEGRPKGTCNQRLDMVSGSQQNSLTTRLRAMFGDGSRTDPVNWTTVVNRCCSMGEEAYMSKVQATPLSQIPDVDDDEYVVEGFLPRGQLTTMFADGGSGKTYLAIYLAICVIMGMPFLGHPVSSATIEHVLFIDYEASDSVIRRRFRRVCQGMGLDPDALFDHFHYFPGRGIPLEHQANQLERALEQSGAKLMIVDSAAAAAGGEPEKSESALSVFNTFGLMPPDTTELLIAHNTKEGQSDKPFGSVFWHNNSRMTHYVAGAQPPGAPFIHVGIWNRKVNDDTLQRPFGVLISFDGRDGEVKFELEDPIDDSVKPSRRKETSMAIVEILQQNAGGMSTSELGVALEIEGIQVKPQSVRNALDRLRKNGVLISQRVGRATRWVLNIDRPEDGSDDEQEAPSG